MFTFMESHCYIYKLCSYSKCLSYHCPLSFIMFWDDMVLGMTWSWCLPPAPGKKSPHLLRSWLPFEVGVDPQYGGKGLCTRLVKLCMEKARQWPFGRKFGEGNWCGGALHYNLKPFFLEYIPVGLPSKEQDQHLVRTTTEAVTLSCGQNWHPVEDFLFQQNLLGPSYVSIWMGRFLNLCFPTGSWFWWCHFQLEIEQFPWFYKHLNIKRLGSGGVSKIRFP